MISKALRAYPINGLPLYQTPFRAGSYSLAENFTRDRSGLRERQQHVNACAHHVHRVRRVR